MFNLLDTTQPLLLEYYTSTTYGFNDRRGGKKISNVDRLIKVWHWVLNKKTINIEADYTTLREQLNLENEAIKEALDQLQWLKLIVYTLKGRTFTITPLPESEWFGGPSKSGKRDVVYNVPALFYNEAAKKLSAIEYVAFFFFINRADKNTGIVYGRTSIMDFSKLHGPDSTKTQVNNLVKKKFIIDITETLEDDAKGSLKLKLIPELGWGSEEISRELTEEEQRWAIHNATQGKDFKAFEIHKYFLEDLDKHLAEFTKGQGFYNYKADVIDAWESDFKLKFMVWCVEQEYLTYIDEVTDVVDKWINVYQFPNHPSWADFYEEVEKAWKIWRSDTMDGKTDEQAFTTLKLRLRKDKKMTAERIAQAIDDIKSGKRLNFKLSPDPIPGKSNNLHKLLEKMKKKSTGSNDDGLFDDFHKSLYNKKGGK